jgi:hypothetical protein
VGLAAVRDIRPHLRLETPDEVGAFEQDLLAEFVLARSSAGITDTTISADVAAVVGLREWFGRPLWEMTACDLDRFFGADQKGLAAGTKVRKAAAFAVFFVFLELRHRPGIHAATGFVVESPLDEVNGRGAGPARVCGSRRASGRSTGCSPAGALTCSRPASTHRPPGTTPRCGWPA